MVQNIQAHNSRGSSSTTTVTQALNGTTILVTGAAGFVGTALLFRLLCDPKFSGIKKVIALIRGETVEKATKRLPQTLQPFTLPDQNGEGSEARLVVLTGDCGRPNFGLKGQDLEQALKTDIVIHAAGDTRFTLPLQDAIGSISDLSYMSSRFSLTSPRVKTHIHLSTSFVGWFLDHGKVVKEDFIQNDLDADVTNHSDHVNTYFHAKTLAEGCVNALFTQQAGRKLHRKAARIFRLSTIGPAVDFPRKGWGAGHPSSPVCAALAAEKVKDLSALVDGAFLDVIPIDVAVNQIVALTAAVHSTHSLPLDDEHHPRNPLNPLNQHMTNIPVYNVCSGLRGEENISIDTLNSEEVKIEEPYIPEKNLMKVYKPFLTKILDFDNQRAKGVLGMKGLSPNGTDDASAVSSKLEDQLRLGLNLEGGQGEPAALGTDPESDGEDSSEASATRSSRSSSSSSSDSDSTSSEPESTATTVTTSTANLGSKADGYQATSWNLGAGWRDPSIDVEHLEVDVGPCVVSRWGELDCSKQGSNTELKGWKGYLRMISDEMEEKGPREDWVSYVD
ncbi:hypothetical protein IE53DRAFT_391171 [Violaceomyces palustris]|uniref:Uncharacterized protein n=1 Tax=Violaceomyces palustris TaxID=1673888 RepID=A0ACD0NLF9_9BASI|nr:hypothetical protein IE53DRAFT_391171 [Violaceomyces palustris]